MIDVCVVKLLLSGFIGIYTAYYFLCVRSPPVLYGGPQSLLKFFRTHMPFLNDAYSPFVFGFTGRVQTLLRPLFHRAKKCDYEIEIFRFSDGGETQLSWSNLKEFSDNTPIVVILPGLTGCGCGHYITSLVHEVNRCNYRCVVSNSRGTCRHKLTTPKTYCAADTSDISAIMSHIRKYYPNAPMVAVGISLGGILVFNYLASEFSNNDKPCPLTAAMCVCMPWDLIQTSNRLEKSFDWFLFNYPLTQRLHHLVKRNADVLSKKYDVPRVLKTRSVREFDAKLTANMFGFKSVEEYYMTASPTSKIDRIRIPVLCFNASDDPFVPSHTLPVEKVETTQSPVVLATTRHGGHIGFLMGLRPTRPNLLDRAVPEFASAVFENLEEFVTIAAQVAGDTGGIRKGPKLDGANKEGASTKEMATFK